MPNGEQTAADHIADLQGDIAQCPEQHDRGDQQAIGPSSSKCGIDRKEGDACPFPQHQPDSADGIVGYEEVADACNQAGE